MARWSNARAMPYERTIRFESPLLSWHELRLLAGASDWSPAYRAATPRLLLPRSHWIECERSGRRFVCDPVTPLWLTPDLEYRTRQPWAGQCSTVLILPSAWPVAPMWHAPLPADAAWRLAQAARALEGGEADTLRLEELLLGLLRRCFESKAPALPRPAVERAREFLATHPQHNHSLQAIAQAAHCSPYHLARQFRRSTGLSLHGYRTRLRMALGIERLRGGEQSLSALAVDLGYSSHSHFSTVFRRHFGIGPQQMRTDLVAPPLH
jgi:AraC family transcriptional regulator